MATAVREIDARWRNALSSLITEGNQSGEFVCIDPEASAGRITALLDGLAVRVVARRDELSSGLRQSWVVTVLDFELAAA